MYVIGNMNHAIEKALAIKNEDISISPNSMKSQIRIPMNVSAAPIRYM